MIDRPPGEELGIAGIAGGDRLMLPRRHYGDEGIPPGLVPSRAATDNRDTDIGSELAAGLPCYSDSQSCGGGFGRQAKTSLEARLKNA